MMNEPDDEPGADSDAPARGRGIFDPPPDEGPTPIVGMPVQYYTNEITRHSPRQGTGPYAAIITEVVDADSGMVCLFVRPPFSHGYDVANVKYGVHDDMVDDSWVVPGF